MFQPGQEVECINDQVPVWAQILWKGYTFVKKGQRYTVRWCGERPSDVGPAVFLNEIIGPLNPHWKIEQAFSALQFRAIQKTDISVFEQLKNPIPVKQLDLVE